MGDPKTDLEREFCPPIEPALLYVLQSDYDLSDESSVVQLKALLGEIKISAEAEELSILNPQGSSTNDDELTTEESPERAQSWHGDTLSEDTELTAASESHASCAIDRRHDDTTPTSIDSTVSYGENGVEELSAVEKSSILREMFPVIRPFDIEHAFKKARGNFGRAVEDLLNQSFFEEERLRSGSSAIQRGVDGFAESVHGVPLRGRGARSKRKKQQRRTSSTPASDFADFADSKARSPPQSRWDRAKEEVEFIAQRVHVSRQTISSIYHSSGASIPSTITTLCSSQESTASNPYLAFASSSVLEANIRALSREFPNLGKEVVETLISITHPSTASAHELARALVIPTHGLDLETQIVPQYSTRPRTPPSPPTADLAVSSPLPATVATKLELERSTAFTQASAAYRKSKSKPLMAGAAGYYSSVGREATAELARHVSTIANELVDKQSQAGEVDLHGVSVKDAVRITRSKVHNWWDGGAAEWARQGKVQGDGGLKIITGVGRHSEGGRSKIGPAVGAMLVREGWRVEVGEGMVLVRGRMRK